MTPVVQLIILTNVLFHETIDYHMGHRWSSFQFVHKERVVNKTVN